MATRAYKQDLPPKGGYAKLDFARIPARRIVNGKEHNFVESFQ